jgi:uncharacterized protein
MSPTSTGRLTLANYLCHFEFMGSVAAKTKAFYSKVFDWKYGKEIGGYTMVSTGQAPDGGIMTKPAEAPAPCFQVYFFVGSIEATLEKVRMAGGDVIVPKTPVGDMGWFAIFADPDGIPVGIWKSAEKATKQTARKPAKKASRKAMRTTTKKTGKKTGKKASRKATRRP